MSATHFEYSGRYPFMRSRAGVWQEIARRVAADAPGARDVIELGAGYCDFINAFDAPGRKVAYDLNPEMRQHAGPGVELRIEDAVPLAGLAPASFDLAFASNFLEHLPRPLIGDLMRRLAEVIRPGGHVALVQPNFRLASERYFEDETHVTVFSDESLAQLLADHGFVPEVVCARFLPLTMKSRLPKWPVLVRLYLASPLKPGAGQMYLVGRKR